MQIFLFEIHISVFNIQISIFEINRDICIFKYIYQYLK